MLEVIKMIAKFPAGKFVKASLENIFCHILWPHHSLAWIFKTFCEGDICITKYNSAFRIRIAIHNTASNLKEEHQLHNLENEGVESWNVLQILNREVKSYVTELNDMHALRQGWGLVFLCITCLGVHLPYLS